MFQLVWHGLKALILDIHHVMLKSASKLDKSSTLCLASSMPSSLDCPQPDKSTRVLGATHPLCHPLLIARIWVYWHHLSISVLAWNKVYALYSLIPLYKKISRNIYYTQNLLEKESKLRPRREGKISPFYSLKLFHRSTSPLNIFLLILHAKLFKTVHLTT